MKKSYSAVRFLVTVLQWSGIITAVVVGGYLLYFISLASQVPSGMTPFGDTYVNATYPNLGFIVGFIIYIVVTLACAFGVAQVLELFMDVAASAAQMADS